MPRPGPQDWQRLHRSLLRNMEQSQKYVADDWKKAMFLYDSALKQVSTKIGILSEEFVNVHNYNPIEHIKTRIKSRESIEHKLKKQGYDVTIENLMHYLHDVAGVRIICSFEKDIYNIADMICDQDDVKVLIIKNYIANPKPNGYKSYHLVVSVPIYLSHGPVETKVEIQIRTIAMDFWASLEHKIKYKFEGNAPDSIQNDLRECADIVDMLDKKMFSLNEEIKAFSEMPPDEENNWR